MQLMHRVGWVVHSCPPSNLGCSGANLVGYRKCSKAAENQIRGKFNSLFASGLRAYMFSGQS